MLAGIILSLFVSFFSVARWERGDTGRQGDKGGGTGEEESGRERLNRRRCGETDETGRGKEPNREAVGMKRRGENQPAV